MNGVYINIDFNKIELQKRKDIYKIKIDKGSNKEILDMISKIEHDILDLLPKELIKIYTLDNEYDKCRQLKRYSNIELKNGLYDNFTCTLRIFGVWKDSTRCGLNYQYMVY